MTALKRIIKYVKITAEFGVWYNKDTSDVLAGYSDADQAGNLMIERVIQGVVSMWEIILSLG